MAPRNGPTTQQGRKAASEERQEKVADLYVRRRTLRAIGVELGVSRQTVLRDLQAVRGRWKQNAEMRFEERVARELATIDRVESEAWAGWERSCLDHVQERTEQEATPPKRKRKGEDEKPILGKVRKVTAREGQAGDPRFLAIVENCVDRRCRILGVDAPKRLEHSGRGGGPIETVDVNERAERIHRLAGRLAERIRARELGAEGSPGNGGGPVPSPGGNGTHQPN